MKARWVLLVFVVASFVFGLVEWWRTNWWAYEGYARDYELPLFSHIFLSGCQGVFAGGITTGVVFALGRFYSAARKRM
jgi:hypothetical protein